eukprot:TRINITY_DN2087_c0_g1_i3.p1 TRINITY_DN2087_c0_g1~~TRINITY_DN2087_c0_g1_i3.p1  ORF type:complete len:263 (+),score=59.68 TRINITY_DN2087_c0_g1_i3:496-1284(+)
MQTHPGRPVQSLTMCDECWGRTHVPPREASPRHADPLPMGTVVCTDPLSEGFLLYGEVVGGADDIMDVRFGTPYDTIRCAAADLQPCPAAAAAAAAAALPLPLGSRVWPDGIVVASGRSRADSAALVLRRDGTVVHAPVSELRPRRAMDMLAAASPFRSKPLQLLAAAGEHRARWRWLCCAVTAAATGPQGSTLPGIACLLRSALPRPPDPGRHSPLLRRLAYAQVLQVAIALAELRRRGLSAVPDVSALADQLRAPADAPA